MADTRAKQFGSALIFICFIYFSIQRFLFVKEMRSNYFLIKRKARRHGRIGHDIDLPGLQEESRRKMALELVRTGEGGRSKFTSVVKDTMNNNTKNMESI